jgi:hypothetical protein
MFVAMVIGEHFWLSLETVKCDLTYRCRFVIVAIVLFVEVNYVAGRDKLLFFTLLSYGE